MKKEKSNCGTQVFNIPRPAGLSTRNITHAQIISILPQLVKPERQDIAGRESSIFFGLVTHAVDVLAETVRERIRAEHPDDETEWKYPPWSKVTKIERERAAQTLISLGEKEGLELERARWACQQAIYIRWKGRYDQQKEKKKAPDR